MSDELLTAAEAAALLKMTLDGFYRWRRRHHIPNAIAGRALRFRKDDLIATRPQESRVIDFRELGRRHARGELHRA